MKPGNFILIAFLINSLGIISVSAQDNDTVKSMPFYVPQTTTIGLYSNFHWYINEGVENTWADQFYLGARLRYSRSIQAVIINRTRIINGNVQNRFTDLYLNYFNYIRPKKEIPLFKNGTFLDLKVGMLQWFPTYTNPQQILENAEDFINPEQVYGGSIITVTPLTGNQALNLHIGAHTGDPINNDLDPQLHNLYLNYTQIYKHNLGVSVQAGIAQGSKHLVNFAHLLYLPKLEAVQFIFKAGKLPAFDESPYGAHFGFERRFNYVFIGGYYERRLDKMVQGEIAGVTFGIIGPPKLAKFVSNFNFFYDFNTNSIWMWVPVLKVDIRHK